VYAPANAANPATSAPISAVANTSKNGLSVFKINTETLCASMLWLFLLIQKLKIPHNRNKEVNPVMKAGKGACRNKAVTVKATIAILHHGKYKQVVKLNNAIKNIEVINFIVSTGYFYHAI